ncbi:MAG: hypothetical protein J6Y39_06715 [Bacteroidaceae bacterium]|nr:hypothetical protein [Bacteroidaceae bacterium]
MKKEITMFYLHIDREGQNDTPKGHNGSTLSKVASWIAIIDFFLSIADMLLSYLIKK